ncbi:ComF family protein [Pseudoalteromonas luteoviolacea]|uniref:Phosphoribosyltransferase domain-containing protein n=1 Tax=Pseudoalteromonas luteoviolacea S4054 TaxID=1129367 RepID=A0A0F6ACC2_9GAMM|nr:phosphoribosyltransferase family protein [Pseudoalteromonas luteoviolacea]AOT06732.1 hypothetical protein S4054249_02010 [Pseudoalteromonas luteoviolacea]AOT11650.1 hypothetical protein S40542_02010 [Pseudoalteromonas luteoviolacea]AOT16562.1 hypothetical protein S4054_02010 [Pseudoalteromonas luteoviolacea]KKE83820.1 hypothetical protein N479_12570 [Pseudoalteromonas luteoviolacea S4054]KZN73897.1 hypothetical protein N481_10685 [Pseudoalteromonas luteoviolacea S4047-1]
MSLMNALRKSLLPAKCASCQSYIESPGICRTCYPTLPLFELEDSNLLLRPDINRMFNLPECDGLSACGWYHGQLAMWLKQIKYHRDRHAIKVIRQIIMQQWRRLHLHSLIQADACVIVPLAKTRLLSRGYNQVYQTWGKLLDYHHIPMLTVIAKHARPSHVLLSKSARQHNARQAFYLTGDIKHKRILIVDDVITSGATMNAVAALCKQAGAQTVWACATCITEL